MSSPCYGTSDLLQSPSKRCFDGHPKIKVSYKRKTRVRLWTHSADEYIRGNQDEIPSERAHWSDYYTDTSNRSDETRYGIIKYMHIGVKLLYDHGRTTDWDLTKRLSNSIVNDSG